MVSSEWDRAKEFWIIATLPIPSSPENVKSWQFLVAELLLLIKVGRRWTRHDERCVEAIPSVEIVDFVKFKLFASIKSFDDWAAFIWTSRCVGAERREMVTEFDMSPRASMTACDRRLDFCCCCDCTPFKLPVRTSALLAILSSWWLLLILWSSLSMFGCWWVCDGVGLCVPLSVSIICAFRTS